MQEIAADDGHAMSSNACKSCNETNGECPDATGHVGTVRRSRLSGPVKGPITVVLFIKQVTTTTRITLRSSLGNPLHIKISLCFLEPCLMHPSTRIDIPFHSVRLRTYTGWDLHQKAESENLESSFTHHRTRSTLMPLYFDSSNVPGAYDMCQ